MQTNDGIRMRGTVIKIPGSTPGLILVNGQQKAFLLENVWLSPVAPMANMTVEVSTDASGAIAAMTVVDAQQLAREKFEQFSGVAQAHGKEAAGAATQGILSMAGRMGKTSLILTVLFWIIWFGMPAVALTTPMFDKSFTFWEMLGIDWRTTLTSHGLFSLAAVCAIAAPFAVPFIRDQRARWLCAAPLAATVVGMLAILSEVHDLIKDVQGIAGRALTRQMGQMFSIRPGVYLLIVLGVLLAMRAIRLGRSKSSGPLLALVLITILGTSSARAQSMNARGDGAATGPEAERVWAAVGNMPYAAQGSGPELYVLAYSTCPYAAQFFHDWAGKLSQVQVRWILYPVSEATAAATADVAYTRDAAVVAAIFEKTRVSPPIRTSPQRVDAYNSVANGAKALNDVFAQYGRYHIISPTFIWRSGSAVFVSRGYEKAAFQQYVLNMMGQPVRPPDGAASVPAPGARQTASQRTPLSSENVAELNATLKNHNGDAILKIAGMHAAMQSPDYTRDNIVADGVFQPRPSGGIYRGMRDMVLWPNSHVTFLQLSALTDDEHDVLHLVVRSDLGAFAPVSFLLPKGQLSTLSKLKIMQIMDPFVAFAAADSNTFKAESSSATASLAAGGRLQPSHPPMQGCAWVPFASKKYGLELLVSKCKGRDQWVFGDTVDGIGMGSPAQTQFEVHEKPAAQPMETAIQQQVIAKFGDSQARANCRAVRLQNEEQPGWHEYGVEPFGAYAHPKPAKGEDMEKGDGLCNGMWGADVSSAVIYNPAVSKTHFFVLYGLSDPIKDQPYDIFSLRFLRPASEIIR